MLLGSVFSRVDCLLETEVGGLVWGSSAGWRGAGAGGWAAREGALVPGHPQDEELKVWPAGLPVL